MDDLSWDKLLELAWGWDAEPMWVGGVGRESINLFRWYAPQAGHSHEPNGQPASAFP